MEVMDEIAIEKYPVYKDSGVKWLSEIPEHWNIIRFKYLFDERNERSYNGDEELLSVSQYTGVTKKSENVDEGELLTNASTLEGYKKVYKGDLVSNIMLAWNGSLGFSSYNGITSPAYSVYRLKIGNDRNYYHYLVRSEIYKAEFKRNSSGVIESRLRLYSDDFYKIFSLQPPIEEQTAIARFLDNKTALIDKAIAIKERQIELLKERRQILVNQAVIRGVNPGAKLKDSGIQYIGHVPIHWTVKKLKYILQERNERSINGTEPLLMMSQTYGLVVRSEFHEKAEVAKSSEGNKLVYTDDLVFNKLKAHLGVFFKSTLPFIGLVSPDYAVYQSNGTISDVKYLEILFRKPEYIREFICRATGIVEGLIRLYTKDLFDMYVPVPPEMEQSEILANVEIIDKKVNNVMVLKEREIDKLKEYKNILINSAVTGKIRVR